MRNVKAVHFYLLILIVVGMYSLARAADTERITLGVTTKVGGSALPFWIAQDKGFFKSEGLNTVIVLMPGPLTVAGVISRSLDYATGFQNLVMAAVQGLPIRIVMVVREAVDDVFVTSPGVKKVEDLKGKKIGISGFGGAAHSQVIMILRKSGMNPDKDVIFTQIGGSGSRYAALVSGVIDAAILVPPFNKIVRKMGFNELVKTSDFVRIPSAGVGVNIDKMRERPDEIIRIIKAILKSMSFIRTHERDVLSYMEKNWEIKDPEVREEVYRDIIELYSSTGMVANDSITRTIRLVEEAQAVRRSVDLSAIVDWSFVKRANEELKKK